MICVDASLAVKWVLTDEERADRALNLLRAQVLSRQEVIAPPLLYSEATNILRQRIRQQQLPIAWAMEMLDDFMALPIVLLSPTELFHEALWLAAAYDLPATYDAQYVALAQLSACELWTDDQRLIRQLQPSLPFVRAIGEF